MLTKLKEEIAKFKFRNSNVPTRTTTPFTDEELEERATQLINVLSEAGFIIEQCTYKGSHKVIPKKFF